MFDSETEARLRRLFEAPGASRPDHAKELEDRLLAAFAARYPKKEKIPMSKFVVRRTLMLAAAVGVLGVVACTAPVDLDVEVGRSLEIRYDPQLAASAPPQAVAEFLQKLGQPDEKGAGEAASGRTEVGVSVRQEGQGLTIGAELWGSNLPDGPLAPRIKAAFPALAGAEFKEASLHGKVRGTLAQKLRLAIDRDALDTTDVETARKQVMEQLKARGVDGHVEVKVEGEHGARKVMIKVEKRAEDGADTAVTP